MTTSPTVADIFRRFGPAYRDLYGDRMPIAHLKAMRAIETCRTPAQGGHLYECDTCGAQHFVAHSCRNRHCPTCQFLPAERWVEARKQDLLPIPYFHVTFTLPAELHNLVRANPRVGYDLFFKAAAGTLLTLADDPKHLGAKVGFIAVLQTWSQILTYHPHIHCILTGGGLSPDQKHWVRAQDRFLIHVHVFGALFRGKFLHLLKGAANEGQLDLDSPTDFRGLLNTLYHKRWNVDCRPPYDGPKDAVEYLGRYTQSVAISNSRILAVNGDKVAFRHRDPSNPGRTTTSQLPAIEFIRRFLLHILPSGFVKIRYFGILANRNRRTLIARARILLLIHPDPEPTTPQAWDQLLYALTGIDPFKCPYCGEGTLVLKAKLQPLRAPPNHTPEHPE